MLNFFKSINLNVTIDEKCVLQYKYNTLLEHLKNPIPLKTEDDLIKDLESSYSFEGDNMNPDTYKLLFNTPNDDIEKIYSCLNTKNPFKRTQTVYVLDEWKNPIHTGLKPSLIKYDALQLWVNEFHKHEFETEYEKILVGFILHLFYVRIHPHYDGNGRMARYLFLENKELMSHLNLCPLSIILNKQLGNVKEVMKEIFSIIDKEEDYYSMYPSNKLFKLINYIIYISTTYKYAKHYIPDFDDYLDDIDMNDIFTRGRLQKYEIGSQKHHPPSQVLDFINTFIKKLNEVLDFNIHTRIIGNLLKC